MARKKSGQKPSLHGRQIMKQRVKKKRHGRAPREEYEARHVAEEMMGDDGGAGLTSVVERSDVEEFLVQALMSERDFEATKSNVLILDANDKAVALEDLPKEAGIDEGDEEKAAVNIPKNLPIPRRPHWDATTTKSELDRTEREAFLEWRRQLALIEESTKRVMSPFEKNLEVWKQLWRVVERSQVVVQIVDARDPALYRCVDLERYVRSSGKANLLLINKADCLSPHMRAVWADYFRKQGVLFCFFSALAEAEAADMAPKISRGAKAVNEDGEEEEDDDDEEEEEYSEEEDSEEDEDEEEEDDDEAKTGADEAGAASPAQSPADEPAAAAAPPQPEERADTRVMTKDQLLRLLEKMCELAGLQRDSNDRFTVGMVGYPNVGKSSTINVLYGEKKVSVAPTPGKTKNFQTLFLNESIVLCDCPGLVFPTMVNSRPELVVSGVLPVDQMREYVRPIDVICRRIPRAQFHSLYRLSFPPGQPVKGQQLLDAHASMRGFMKDHGRPDANRSARIIVKDYVNARLLFCHHPPGLDDEARTAWFRDFLVWTRQTVAADEDEAAVAAKVAAERLDASASVQATQRAAARDLTAPHRPPGDGAIDLSKLTKKERRRLIRLSKDRKGRRRIAEDELGTVEAHTTGKRGQRNFRRANHQAGQR